MATIPLSAKAQKEESKQASAKPYKYSTCGFTVDESASKKIIIKPIECCNDYIAVLQFEIETTIAVSTKEYRNEGIVIGRNPDSKFNLGDVLLFNKNIVTALSFDKHPYEGKKLLILQERNVLCRLPSIEFEII